MFGRRQRVRQEYIAQYTFRSALEDRFAMEHPSLDEGERALVFEGLRKWFQVCRLAGDGFVAMPSAAVDDAWHEFILFTRDYDAFCQRAFGRFLHHTPTVGLGVDNARDVMRDGYVLSWHRACDVEGRDPYAADGLPLLFGLDERLDYPAGFVFDVGAIRAERGAARSLVANAPVSVTAPAAVAHRGGRVTTTAMAVPAEPSRSRDPERRVTAGAEPRAAAAGAAGVEVVAAAADLPYGPLRNLVKSSGICQCCGPTIPRTSHVPSAQNARPRWPVL